MRIAAGLESSAVNASGMRPIKTPIIRDGTLALALGVCALAGLPRSAAAHDTGTETFRLRL
jgi:hypothetical protein